MAKRAVDLTVGELAAMGAKAAHLAAQEAQAAGLVITGTLDIYDAGQPASSLAQLHPSGTVTLVREGDTAVAETTALRAIRDRATD